MVGCWAGRLPPYLYENSAARAGRVLMLNDHAPANAADDLRTERRDSVINPSLISYGTVCVRQTSGRRRGRRALHHGPIIAQAPVRGHANKTETGSGWFQVFRGKS